MITKELMAQKVKKKRLVFILAFPFIYLFYKLLNWLKPQIYKPGIHVITGDTGGGKTLLAHMLAKGFRRKKRKVYSNSAFSKEVKKIDLLEYFGDFEQKKEIKNCVLILDEISQEFNRRLNRSNNYNSVFIPLKQFMQTHRHDGVTHIYLLAQSFDDLDGQLINIAQKVHFVAPKFNVSLSAWIRQKRLRPMIRPTKIRFFTRKKRDFIKGDFEKYVSRHQIKYRPPQKGSVKITIKDLIDFDTHAFRNHQLKPKALLKDKAPNKALKQEKKEQKKEN